MRSRKTYPPYKNSIFCFSKMRFRVSLGRKVFKNFRHFSYTALVVCVQKTKQKKSTEEINATDKYIYIQLCTNSMNWFWRLISELSEVDVTNIKLVNELRTTMFSRVSCINCEKLLPVDSFFVTGVSYQHEFHSSLITVARHLW